MLYLRLKKILLALGGASSRKALARFGVLAATEHRCVLSKKFCTVVDIGANKGQFALAARHYNDKCKIIAFEPLSRPADIFRRVFLDDPLTTLHQTAIGSRNERSQINVSRRDDSSSILPMSTLQTENFPGTEALEVVSIDVKRLDEVLESSQIKAPALLKIDVQGYELDVLKGSEQLIAQFSYVYCECSFVELYSGQALAPEIIQFMSERHNFRLIGLHNVTYSRTGEALQADLLFVHAHRQM